MLAAEAQCLRGGEQRGFPLGTWQWHALQPSRPWGGRRLGPTLGLPEQASSLLRQAAVDRPPGGDGDPRTQCRNETTAPVSSSWEHRRTPGLAAAVEGQPRCPGHWSREASSRSGPAVLCGGPTQGEGRSLSVFRGHSLGSEEETRSLFFAAARDSSGLHFYRKARCARVRRSSLPTSLPGLEGGPAPGTDKGTEEQWTGR